MLHLIELRKRLLLIFTGFIIIFGILFHFSNQLYLYLSSPLLNYLPNNSHLIAIDVTSPVLVPLRLAAILAFIISLPNTIYQIWQFVAPGLYRQERQLFIITILLVIILFVFGILFCYFVVLPLLFRFVTHFKSINIVMLIDISRYLNFVLNLFFLFGIVFQTPIVIVLATKFKLIDLQTLIKFRSYVIVGAFVIAAIVTPPDVVSQILLALPLYLLYEVSIIIARWFNRK
jgi:sec-independent protein translocase protein TatC